MGGVIIHKLLVVVAVVLGRLVLEGHFHFRIRRPCVLAFASAAKLTVVLAAPQAVARTQDDRKYHGHNYDFGAVLLGGFHQGVRVDLDDGSIVVLVVIVILVAAVVVDAVSDHYMSRLRWRGRDLLCHNGGGDRGECSGLLGTLSPSPAAVFVFPTPM